MKPPPSWSSKLGKVMVYALLCTWSAICLFPLYWIGVTSLKDVKDIDKPPAYLPFLDYTPSLDAWRYILADVHENLVMRFVNSTIISGASTLITIVIGGMAIYGLTRFRSVPYWTSMVSGCLAVGLVAAAVFLPALVVKSFLLASAGLAFALAYWLRQWGPRMTSFGAMTFILATRVLPPVVVVLPLYIMAQATGMRDTLSALILVYTAINLPVAVWLMQPLLGPRATEQEEAAQLDGASHLQIFFTILLPMVRQSVVAVGLLVCLLCWNEYLFAAYLTADHALTLPPWMVGQLSMKEAQVGGEAEEWTRLSAATLVMIFPALIFASFTQRLLGGAFVRRQ